VKRLQTHSDAWVENAPERCVAEREINATPTAIWDVLADHESWPEWFTAVKDVTVTGAASGVGARRRVRIPGVEFHEEFVAWDVGKRFAFTVTEMSVGLFESLNERVTIDTLDGGRSRVTYTQALEPVGWFRLPFKAVKGLFARSLGKGLDSLARRVE